VEDTPGVSAHDDATQVLMDETSSDEQTPLGGLAGDGTSSPPAAEHDYLADLQRLQAEFDNYRKRVMRERTEVAGRAKARFVEGLLPVIDNFERAIAHGEGGEGVRLVLRELEGVLAAEGIEEIVAEGQPFDPRFHEAVESVEDPEVSEPIVTAVRRRGWRSGDHVIRAPMVRVARPTETETAPEDLAGAEE
jgi:molecular chaperone GrpE